MFANPFTKADNTQRQQQQQVNQPNQNQQQQQQTTQGVIPDGSDQTDDPNNKQQKKDGASDDPLLDFNELWQPNKDKDGKVIQDQQGPTSYLPAIDPTKFAGMVEKMDFTRSIKPEDWAAIQAGGDGATKALANVLNTTVRQSFMTTFSAMNKLVEQGFSGAEERFLGKVPDHVRDIMVDSSLEGSNPIVSNPAFAPMVKSVKQQYLNKYPKASPGAVNKAVNAYFDKMYQDMEAHKAGGVNKNKNNQRPNALSQGTDDADFLGWLGKEVGAQTEDPNQQ